MASKEKLAALKTTIWLKAPTPKVWKAVSEARHLGRWFTTPKKMELKKGGRWDFVGFPGKVLQVKKGKSYSFMHRFMDADSRISYELIPMKKYTELVVTHDQFGKSKNTRDCWNGAWGFILCNLKTYVETGKPMWETAFRGSDE